MMGKTLFNLTHEESVLILPKEGWVGGTCFMIMQKNTEFLQDVQISGGGAETLLDCFCAGDLEPLWRLPWAGLVLQKEKHTAAYGRRVLGTTNSWLSQTLPLSFSCSLTCRHIICLLWLGFTHLNLAPNPVLLPEEHSQPLTEHSYTPGRSMNFLQLEVCFQ